MPLKDDRFVAEWLPMQVVPDPVLLAIVVASSGLVAAVAYHPSRLPDVTLCATGAGLPDLLAWLRAHIRQTGGRAVLIERGPWLNTLAPAASLGWAVAGMSVGLEFVDPDHAEDHLFIGQSSLSDSPLAAQRALAHAIAWAGQNW